MSNINKSELNALSMYSMVDALVAEHKSENGAALQKNRFSLYSSILIVVTGTILLFMIFIITNLPEQASIYDLILASFKVAASIAIFTTLCLYVLSYLRRQAERSDLMENLLFLYKLDIARLQAFLNEVRDADFLSDEEKSEYVSLWAKSATVSILTRSGQSPTGYSTLLDELHALFDTEVAVGVSLSGPTLNIRRGQERPNDKQVKVDL